MSTQGVVAVGDLTGWRGIYNNSDSYPTCLGANIRATLVEKIAGGQSLRSISENILLFDDWRNFISGGVCPYCGKITTQPHSMSSDLVMNAGSPDDFPDPECLRHSHEAMDLEDLQITNEDIDAEPYLEWIYIINVKSRLIHVIDNRERYGGNLHVGDIPLRGAEPNYHHLECSADYSRCDCTAWSHFPEIDSEGPQGRLSAKQYLGMAPVGSMSDAIAVILNGHRYRWGGSAFTEEGFMFSKPKLDKRIPNALHAELVIDGEKQWVPVGVLNGKRKVPTPGVAWVFPATKVMPEFAVIGK